MIVLLSSPLMFTLFITNMQVQIFMRSMRAHFHACISLYALNETINSMV